MLRVVLNILWELISVILTINLWNRAYYPLHFTNEENEFQGSKVTLQTQLMVAQTQI